ncbi:MAG: hypothetical protein QOG20_6398 [Pseudonocardiales bacterium]|jgi:hypothetical protein|nr:hypothetical protein [Pseudonocardiales bacterium]
MEIQIQMTRPGETNTEHGGRGVYSTEPSSGDASEMITWPYRCSPDTEPALLRGPESREFSGIRPGRRRRPGRAADRPVEQGRGSGGRWPGGDHVHPVVAAGERRHRGPLVGL